MPRGSCCAGSSGMDAPPSCGRALGVGCVCVQRQRQRGQGPSALWGAGAMPAQCSHVHGTAGSKRFPTVPLTLASSPVEALQWMRDMSYRLTASCGAVHMHGSSSSSRSVWAVNV